MHAEKSQLAKPKQSINPTFLHRKSRRTGRGFEMYKTQKKTAPFEEANENILKFNSALIEYVIQTRKPTNEFSRSNTTWWMLFQISNRDPDSLLEGNK